MIYTIAIALLLLPLSALQSAAQSAPPGDLRADFARILMPSHQPAPQPAPAPAPAAVRAADLAPQALPQPAARPVADPQPAASPQSTVAAQPVAAQDSDPPARIRVGGNVQKMKIIKMVQPKYPADAKAEKVQGIVRLKVRINQEGFVVETEIEESPDDRLSASAQEAVSQWVYEPTLLNGKPVEVLTVVDVNYTLQ
jgi:TonB family protein